MNRFKISLIVIFILSNFHASLVAQYSFSTEKLLPCTTVKNQQRTGTCWSFATASFMESEALRIDDKSLDLSEMYVVRKIYEDKAQNYILRQGKANFGQGSLSHDLIRVINNHGIVPEEIYPGKESIALPHDHSELESGLKGYLDGLLKIRIKDSSWRKAVSAILDAYLGPLPQTFEYQGVQYTPKSFAEALDLEYKDYVSLSSFNHHPFYKQFILEVPDNYSNGSYYNLPLDEFISVIDFALLEGYSVAWDGDVSEKGFSAADGLAVLPSNPSRSDLFVVPGNELEVTQENRQENFENLRTTDDHLMHIVGISFDQNGTKYYVVKNSWGEISKYKGYLYMSEAYLKMKTISVMVHKNALPEKAAQKLFASLN